MFMPTFIAVLLIDKDGRPIAFDHEQTEIEAFAGTVQFAGIICLVAALIWLLGSLITRRRNQKWKVPYTCWALGGSSIGLYLLGVTVLMFR